MTSPSPYRSTSSCLAICNAAWVLSCNSVAHASSITILCPAEFPVQTINFGPPPQGWTPFAPSSLRVGSGELMYGPPSSYQSAKPSSYREERNRNIASWKLRELTKEEKWLSCGYGMAAELTLSRQLPGNVAECTIITDKDSYRNVTAVHATCTLSDVKTTAKKKK